MGGLPLTSHLRRLVDLVILFTIFALNHHSQANIYEVANFTDPNSNVFKHLTVHDVTGDVYIGGVNQLYRLDENLNLIVNVTTGPEYDDDGDGHNTYNKILTFNYDNDDLITCGGYQGVCQKRHMRDLTVNHSSDTLVYVVANTTDGSTVAYVAHHYHFGQPVLYVGTTSTSSNPGNPLVSGRLLEGNRTFHIFGDGGENARVDIDIHLSFTFPVRYVAGFSHNGYSYFVTTQKLSTDFSSAYISKLVRVCQRSEQHYFNSYTEVTLRCQDDSYNLAQAAYLTRPAQDLSQSLTLDDGEEVLFVAFAEGENDPPTPTAKSAICMYKMSVIEMAFQDAAKGCMEGDGLPATTASWMRGATCAGTRAFTRGIHECHAVSRYKYANGVDDQHGYDVEYYTDTLVTSIAVTTVQQHTVGFLGTDTGNVLKIHFINDTNASTYEKMVFTDTAATVLPDMKFDLDNKHFYKTTGASVHKVKVEDCSQYLTCEDCFGSNDPYCGWCTLEKRCTRKANCTRSSETSRWLHLFDANMCVEIEAIDPENGVPIDVANQITLNTIELPEEDSSNTYMCNYDGLFITTAHKDGYNLTCDTPPIESRPTLPPGEDYKTIKLYVRSSETEEDFVYIDFSFYDCNVHTSCSSCVGSNWKCNWCVYENRCAHYLDTRDDSMSIVVGENNVFNISNKTGQPFCPQLKMQNGEVLVPVGLPTEIQVDATNIYDSKSLSGYECLLVVEGEPQTVTATRHNETSVTCNAHEYTYKSLVQEMPVRLILKWNVNHVIDDIYGYTVKLYNCSINRQDCSECLSNITTRLPLNCGWCKGSKKCEVELLCPSNWLPFGTTNNCELPTIFQVWPLSGPFEGNTDIIIQGTDLGKQASDIVSVTVANVPCDHLPDRYSVSKKLECKTSASIAGYTGNVVVTVIANNGDHRTAYHNANFTFRNQHVLDFTPTLGPKSGGTIVVIHGEYINAGRVIEAYFDGSSCLINRIEDVFNETMVFCTTTSSNITKSAALSMSFDGSERLAPLDKKFSFTKDPTVTFIHPGESMLSGGRKITVIGTYFTSIKQPTMLITADRTFSSDQPCDVRSFIIMYCISPPVEFSGTRRNNRETTFTYVTVGFIMDAVEEVRQLDLNFEVAVDPVYYLFAEEGNIREHQGGQLVIQGKDLNLASTKSEVIVTIGQEECRVVSLSSVQLNCIPPDDGPRGVNKTGSATENGLPEVIVEVGNLKFFIGYFKHALTRHTAPGHTTPGHTRPGHTTPGHTTPGPVGLIGGLVTAFVLLLFTVAIVRVYCVRKRTLNRRFAPGENRMETVGMEVRTEQGPPFSNYCKYIAKMVYDLHSSNKGLGVSSQGNTDQAMNHLENFYSLLTNKYFCLVLIRTLEHHHGMAKDQKKALGGLLTITLQKENSMIYLSEILKDLLPDAVTNEDRTKRENVVLTRDYSIVGSMLTAWFAITLYSYIKTNIGKSIYELFVVMTTNAGTEPRKILRGPAKEQFTRICEEMLTVDEQHRSSFPAPIKYMFDMIDSVAENSGIDDRYVTERSKCDSLHLGLWAKILQCPEYIFDINPSDNVKRGLEVIAQAFVEISCKSMNSPSEMDELYEEISTFKTQSQKLFDNIKA